MRVRLRLGHFPDIQLLSTVDAKHVCTRAPPSVCCAFLCVEPEAITSCACVRGMWHPLLSPHHHTLSLVSAAEAQHADMTTSVANRAPNCNTAL